MENSNETLYLLFKTASQSTILKYFLHRKTNNSEI